MLNCCFYLVANMVADREVANLILQKSKLIYAMNYAINNQACCEKMLGQLVWLSSTLIATDSSDKSKKSALGLTRADKNELAQIAKKGL